MDRRAVVIICNLRAIAQSARSVLAREYPKQIAAKQLDRGDSVQMSGGAGKLRRKKNQSNHKTASRSHKLRRSICPYDLVKLPRRYRVLSTHDPFAEAVKTQKEAIKLCDDPKELRTLKKALKVYEARRSNRDIV